MRVLCHGHESPLSESDSLTRLVIVRLHGTVYPMMDLYYTCYDELSPVTMPPFPAATVLGSRFFSYWMLLFTFDTTPTNYCTRVTVLRIVDVTYQADVALAICISSTR